MADATRKFAVIEFIDENFVEVVPYSWIETNEKNVYSYWPTFNAAQKARKGELPDKEKWSKHRIRIFTQTDSYQTGLKKAKLAENTSNIESECEEIHPRNKRRPHRFDETDSDCEDDEKDSDDDISLLNRKKLKHCSYPQNKLIKSSISSTASLPIPPSLHSLTPSSASAPSRKLLETAVTSSAKLKLGLSSVDRKVCSCKTTLTSEQSFCEDTTIQRLNAIDHKVSAIYDSRVTLQMELKSLNETLNEQTALLKKLLHKSGGVMMEEMEDVLPQPINTAEEVEEFCVRLHEQKEFKKNLILYLAALGGQDLGDIVRRIMRKLGTNLLWSSYSLKGRKGKRALQELPVFTLIIKACTAQNPKIQVKEVETEVAEFLKYAPHKCGGNKYQTADMSVDTTRLLPNMCPSLTPDVHEKLRQEGIENALDFLTKDLNELSRKTKISMKTLQTICKVLNALHASVPVSGKDLYDRSLQCSAKLSTGYQSIDDIFDGGFQTEEIIEIYGASGVGKTTLCLNIALHACFQCQRKVLFIDPIASVTYQRVMNSFQNFRNPGVSSCSLEAFQIKNPTNVWELFQLLETLSHSMSEDNFDTDQGQGVSAHRTMKTQQLLVIDSLPQFFYPLMGKTKDKAYGIMNTLEKSLKSLATKKHMVVVIVNNSENVSSQDLGSFSSEAKLKPALGKLWLHVPHHRIFLEHSTPAASTKTNFYDSRKENSAEVIFRIVKSTRLKNASCILQL